MKLFEGTIFECEISVNFTDMFMQYPTVEDIHQKVLRNKELVIATQQAQKKQNFNKMIQDEIKRSWSLGL